MICRFVLITCMLYEDDFEGFTLYVVLLFVFDNCCLIIN